MKTSTVVVLYRLNDRTRETKIKNVVSITNQDGMIVIINKDETEIYYYNQKDVVKITQYAS